MTCPAPPLAVDRAASLGALHVLPDIQIIRGILAHLGPRDLRSTSMVSRYMYVFSRNDFLWKLICIQSRDKASMRLPFRGTWLLTYLFPKPEHDSACAKHPLTNPIQLQGIVSEYLHMQWTRSNMFFGHFYPPPPMPPTPAIGNKRPVNATMPFEDYQQLDQETFYRRYGFPNRPVMLYNSGVETWPAWTRWTMEALLENYGDKPFRVSNLDGVHEPHFPMAYKDFYQYVKYNRDEDPLYLFDPLFADRHEELANDYKVPKYFETDFFALLEGIDRPPYRWILIGPQRTGASWHTDPSGTSAWNTLLSGHKRWALYPPHVTPPGHDPDSPTWLSSIEWYLDVYPFLSPDARPIEVVQQPGQTIYVPSGWWHMVLNMDDTVAVTQNFADETNIMQVKDSMTSEDDLEERWKVFVAELSKARPDLIPALTSCYRTELSSLLDPEEASLEPGSPESTNMWKLRVVEALTKVAGITSKLDDITPIKTGQNVCFMAESKFIKFFTPLNDGLSCFYAEVKANTSLLDVKGGPDILSSPKMVGSGFVFEQEQEFEAAPKKWRWPYVVMEGIQSLVHEDGDMDVDENSLVDAGDYMPDNSEDYDVLVQPILRTLRYYHTLPLKVDQEPSTKDPWTHFNECLTNAERKHTRWRAFPRHLLEQMQDYLPKDAGQVFDPTRGDAVGRLIHGDINPSNILGQLQYPETPFLSNPEAAIPSVQAIPPPPTFEPKTVIDFGDAQFESDPLLDYVSTYVTILNCRQDLTEMMTLLRNSWIDTFGPVTNPESIARRCLWHVLLWPSEGLSLHLVRCLPEIGEMNSWEEVEEKLFGWWKSQ